MGIQRREEMRVIENGAKRCIYLRGIRFELGIRKMRGFAFPRIAASCIPFSSPRLLNFVTYFMAYRQ